MANAQANVVSVKYLAEVTPGTTPAAALTKLRYKSTNIDGKVNTTTSQEIRSDRATADLVRTSATTDGEIAFELSFEEYDPIIAAALGGTYSTPISFTASTVSAASGDNSINDSGAGFPSTIAAGHWIKISGFATASNNGIAKVVSRTSSKIVLSHKTLTTETAGATVVLKGKSVRNGTTKSTFTIEREFPDLATPAFFQHRGMLVNTMTLNATSGSILEGSFGLMGRDTLINTATCGTGAEVVVTAHPIMSATANVGTIYENGTAITGTYFKNINLSTTNNARNLDAIGSLYPIDINNGSFGATVTMESFFSDTALLQKFLNGTATSLAYYFTDSEGNYVVIDLPYIKFTAGPLNGVNLNSDVMVGLTATALNSPTLNYMMQVSMLPA